MVGYITRTMQPSVSRRVVDSLVRNRVAGVHKQSKADKNAFDIASLEHPPPRTQAHSNTLLLTHSLTPIHTQSHPDTLSKTHTQAHSNTHLLTHSLTPTPSFSRTASFQHPPLRTQPHSNTLLLTPSLTPIHTQSHSNTHPQNSHFKEFPKCTKVKEIMFSSML